MARKWEITTWRHQGAKKQLSKDKLFKKVLFLKGGQKWEIKTWRHQGAQKQLCNDRLFNKVLFWKGGQKVGNQDLEPPGG